MAQFGRALRSGRRGRVFESRRLDLLQGLMVKRSRRRPLTAKTGVRFSYKLLLRGVAQFGRALRSGRRGRKFKSCRID